MKYFIPSILWIIGIVYYLSSQVGWNNYFGMLPWEVLVASAALVAPVVINWVVFLYIRFMSSSIEIVNDGIEEQTTEVVKPITTPWEDLQNWYFGRKLWR